MADVPTPSAQERKDFFISYNKADCGWAEWIAWQLQAEGYSVILQAWDFHPGGNFVLQMDTAIKTTRRTVAVLSPDYLNPNAAYSYQELAATLVQDPTGLQGKVLPARVRECKPGGLLAPITYIDLVDLDSAAARSALLSGVRQSRNLPSIEPLYPGQAPAMLPQTPSFPGAWPEIWMVPFARNRYFSGREHLLESLRSRLFASTSLKQSQVPKIQAISGLGGIGKTQTTLEYAYRYQHAYRYVLWLTAADEATLLADVSQTVMQLHLPGADSQEQQQQIASLLRWLVQQRDWLLILDNADDLELVAPFLQRGQSDNGTTLLTTRNREAGSQLALVDVDKLGRQEGSLLLLHRAGLLKPDETLEQASLQDRATAVQIVAELDGLPLALDQAGAYLEEMQAPLEDYLTFYRSHRKTLLARRGRRAPGHADAVATTWELSFQRVEAESSAAAELLRLCAFLAPDAIPEELLRKGVTHLGPILTPIAADAFSLTEAMGPLLRYSLIKRNRESRTLSIHRLVQVVLKDAMSRETASVWAERTVQAINAAFPKVEHANWPLCPRDAQRDTLSNEVARGRLSCCCVFCEEGVFPASCQQASAVAKIVPEAALYYTACLCTSRCASRGLCERLLAHALMAAQLIGDYQMSDPSSAHLLDQTGVYLTKRARYQEAEPLYQRALAICEQQLGAMHPDTATSLNNLASLYERQGKYAQAEPLVQRALHIREQALGREHPDTAQSQWWLAYLAEQQGNYQEAIPLYEQALGVLEQQVGEMHPDTATSLNNLALLYAEQGKYAEAEPLYERALAIYEQQLGAMHPHTAQSLNNLALLYQAQDKYGEAEPLYERALAICEQQLGAMHPDTAGSLSNLALLYTDQGKYAQAEPLSERIRVSEVLCLVHRGRGSLCACYAL